MSLQKSKRVHVLHKRCDFSVEGSRKVDARKGEMQEMRDAGRTGGNIQMGRDTIKYTSRKEEDRKAGRKKGEI